MQDSAILYSEIAFGFLPFGIFHAGSARMRCFSVQFWGSTVVYLEGVGHMFKMIVVDDSELTRRGICESVNWELMDIEIVGEASDGLEAMVLIHDTDPDIIICDVRMPKLDGIALLNEVLPSHPSLQVLFFSGYSDKEYLKNAIKLNAVDYLYKPLQLHELISAVEKAKKKCMNRKVHLPQREADLAISLLQCGENDVASDLPIDVHAPMVTLILQMNAGGDHVADRGYDNQLDDRLLASRHYLAFHNVAAQIFGGKFIMSCVGKGYILHANVSPDFLIRQTAESKLHPLLTTLDAVQADVVVGISNLCAGLQHLREAYDEARAAVHAAFLLGYGRIIFYRDLSQKSLSLRTICKENCTIAFWPTTLQAPPAF